MPQSNLLKGKWTQWLLTCLPCVPSSYQWWGEHVCWPVPTFNPAFSTAAYKLLTHHTCLLICCIVCGQCAYVCCKLTRHYKFQRTFAYKLNMHGVMDTNVHSKRTLIMQPYCDVLRDPHSVTFIYHIFQTFSCLVWTWLEQCWPETQGHDSLSS